MHPVRLIAAVLLVAFLGGVGVPLLGDRHQFNDDPHWALALTTDESEPARFTDAHADDDHCAVCHLLRTMRTAARPGQAGVLRTDRRLAPPSFTDPRTRAAGSRATGARAPPRSFL